MIMADDTAAISEAARERETFKYDALELSTAALLDPEAAKPIPSSVLSLTPDPGLTAFTQLGLYRFDGSRAFISLFDRSNQHVVAEAHRAAPLSPTEDQMDLTWLCGTAISRASSICEHVLAEPASSLTVPGQTTGNAPSDLPVSVIFDLDQDERFCNVRDQQKRFYVGVPIRSPAGINIGVYCVFDDRPRRHVSAVEIQFIRDMSRTVMDYLEAKRSHECYRREERMVRGLGSFVEGKATLSNWSQSSNPSSFKDLPGIREGLLNKKLRDADQRTAQERVSVERRVHEAMGSPVSGTSPVPASRTSCPKTGPKSTPLRKGCMSSAEILQEDVENVFSKASNIIRESIEVEGVLFLDASIRSYGGLIGQDMLSPVLGRPSSEELSREEITFSHGGDAAECVHCRVLGYSTSQSSSINGDEAASPLTILPEKLFHWLLRHYPHGNIFSLESDANSMLNDFNSDLTLSSGHENVKPDMSSHYPSGTASEKPKRPTPRQTVASSLARLFPGATSVAFVPLWDSQRNRWFAGSFVWTRTPTRIFTTENELSYLKVYGLTVMAEVTSLHIKAADKTKMNILGSISHELRSPLHGVVGATELLRHTQLDDSQEKLLRTIHISSRTLLDTIDHLLDYGKITGLVTSGITKTNASESRLIEQHIPTTPSPQLPGIPVPLDRLAEEVVESVLAGYGYMHNVPHADLVTMNSSLSNHQGSWQQSTGDGDGDESPGHQNNMGSEAVQIQLNIEPAESWSFRIHPGAFRRIIMNLFGNSLKFTKTGFINVYMRQDPLPDQSDNHGSEIGKILLTVSDSGKGISEEYLRNQLYTPFAQEDHFAPGTGLGLSLVRQVVTTLEGTIHVTSQVGCGTSVSVSFPLPLAVTMDEEEVAFRRVVQELAGSRVLLRGQGPASAAETLDGISTMNKEHHAKSQLQLIGDTCQGWLGMQVVSEAETEVSPPDFIISTDQSFHGIEVDGTSGADAYPHIFICQNSSTAQSMAGSRRMPAFFELISQPLGPRKLAQSLFNCRLRWKEARSSLPKPGSPASLAKEKPLLLSTPSQAADVAAVLKAAGIIDECGGLLPSAMPPSSEKSTSKPKTDSRVSVEVSEQTGFVPSSSPPGLVLRAVGSRPSILIVDDNPINRKILAAYMRKIEHPHTMATNGLEALEKYKESPYDYSCILTDISMPVMDGLESSRRVREFERARQLRPCKVIALTGLSGTDVQQDAFGSGVDAFLTRPVTLKQVIETLCALGVR